MNVKPGDKAKIIKSIDGMSVGKIVTVISLTGTHSKYGTVWRVEGAGLVSEYGGVGANADVPDDWLQKIEPDDVVLTKDKKLELVD
jgi:hypothetical protein